MAPSAAPPVSVLMVGAGEYTTGYVPTAAGTATDKSKGVVAITMLDMRRRGKVGRLVLCDAVGTKFAAVREFIKTQITDCYKDIDDRMETLPDDDVAFEPTAYRRAMKTMNKGDVVIIFTPDDTHFDITMAAIEYGDLISLCCNIIKNARERVQSLGPFSFFSSTMTQRKSQLDTFAVTAMASTGVADAKLAREVEDTITIIAQWENDNGAKGVATYMASWIAPVADCHTQQYFHYMGHKGEIRVDQSHRGYSLSLDEGRPFQTLNPLYMRYTPDPAGRFAGQSGYGYRSLEVFLDAAVQVNAGETTPQQLSVDGILATADKTLFQTAILEPSAQVLSYLVCDMSLASTAALVLSPPSALSCASSTAAIAAAAAPFARPVRSRKSFPAIIMASKTESSLAAAPASSESTLSLATDLVKLNDGNKIPRIGLGVYQSRPGKETYEAVKTALQVGYRHIDTAALYANEDSVGKAIRDTPDVTREQLWVTTKVWNSDQGYQSTKGALERSLQKLGSDYVDLYLLHAPVRGKRLDSWRALTELQKQGKTRSIGVSNFGIHHLQELMASSNVLPAVNQIEVSPYNTREELCAFCLKHNIQIEAYSPLTQGLKLRDPKLVEIAKTYGRTTAQILIRWAMQRGYIVLPKSVKPARIRENADVYSFSISDEDMKRLNSFDEGLVVGWDPTTGP
eukprot:jgi/Chlat1/9054/Chrsp94S08355